ELAARNPAPTQWRQGPTALRRRSRGKRGVMAEHHSDAVYMRTFWYLLVLTIAEIIVALLPFATLVKGILLVGMALGKASLVAMYFMHLRFERVTLGVIAFTPLVICVFLVFMLTPDLGAVAHKTVAPAKQTTGVKH